MCCVFDSMIGCGQGYAGQRSWTVQHKFYTTERQVVMKTGESPVVYRIEIVFVEVWRCEWGAYSRAYNDVSEV